MTAPVFDVFTRFQVQLIIIRETDDADYGAGIARVLKALDGDVVRRLSRWGSKLREEISQLNRVPAEKALELILSKALCKKSRFDAGTARSLARMHLRRNSRSDALQVD